MGQIDAAFVNRWVGLIDGGAVARFGLNKDQLVN